MKIYSKLYCKTKLSLNLYYFRQKIIIIKLLKQFLINIFMNSFSLLNLLIQKEYQLDYHKCLQNQWKQKLLLIKKVKNNSNYKNH